MANSVADIAIKVVANANGVGPPLNAAEKQLMAFDKKAREIGSSGGGLSLISNSVAGLAAGFGAAALGSGLLNTVNRLDDLGDMADGLGDTAQNLSRLHFAAEQLGSSGEAVDSAMAKMTKSIGTAAIEGGPAREAIEGIGLSVENLQRMAPSQAFIAITNALAKLPNVYDKAAVASKLFGKGAIEIISILKAGSGEIEEYGKRLDELGGTATEAQIETAARLKDQLTELNSTWEGLKSSSLEAFGDPLLGAIKSVQFLTGGLAFNLKVIDGIFATWYGNPIWDAMNRTGAYSSGTQPGGGKGGKSAAQIAEQLAEQEKLQDEAEKYQKKMDTLAQQITQSTRTAIEIRDDEIASLNEVFDNTDLPIEVAERRLQQILAEYQKTVDREQELLGGLMVQTIEALDKPRQEMLTGLEDFFGGMSERVDDFAKSLTDSVKTPMERYQEKIQDITAALDLGAISVETYNRATQKAWADLNGAAGGDMPGMAEAQGIDTALQAMIDFSMPRGGFVGGSIPDNFRLFTPPDMGSRQSIYARDVMDGQGNITNGRNPFDAATVPYMDAQAQADPQMTEQTTYLRQIAENTANAGAVG